LPHSATTDATTAAAPSLSFDPLAASQSGKKKKKAAKASEDVPEALRDLARGLAQLVEGGMGNEDEVHATLAALEAQTRASTGVGEGGASAPDRDLLEGLDGLDEAGYQALLQQFETMGSDPSMASVLDTFMSQLLSKSVLYEPLQQISLRVRVTAMRVSARSHSHLSIPHTWPARAAACLRSSLQGTPARVSWWRSCWPSLTTRRRMWGT